MATVKPAMSPSPASTSFPVLKHDPVVKPNPHPYAIRTTSTGVLSRSNSSGHNASRHHYVPIPTSPTRQREARRRPHKHSKSLNEEGSYFELGAPQPLPVPSSFVSNIQSPRRSQESLQPRRRAETLPSSLTADGAPLAELATPELPSNPKLWTPSQLSSYLLSALRASDPDADESADLPPAAIAAVAEFIKDTKISGRIFLRLNEADMAAMSIDVSWRDALLGAARNLRQRVIKGRIWGADADASPPSGALPSQPFSPLYDSSSASSAELTDDDEGAAAYAKRRRVRGRVRGLVESFERSSSFSSESGADDDASRPDRATIKQWLAAERVPEDALASPVEEKPAAAFVEEPTVETLLAESEGADSWGARAWEKFDAMDPGVTVKRAADAAPGEVGAEEDEVHPTARAIGRRSAGKGQKTERRVVTAVFAPSVEHRQAASDESAQSELLEAPTPAFVQEQAIQVTAEANDAEERAYTQLEAELQESRALVNAFRQRLEVVEAQVTELQQSAAAREQELQKLQSLASAREPAPPPRTPSTKELAADTDTPVHRPSSLSSSLLSLGRPFLPTVLQRAIFGRPGTPGHRARRHAQARGEPDPDEPATMSELPQYVFLVGLGVCAVVIRIMLRKAAGRRG